MKKKVLLAMAVIMVLGSIKAMAVVDEDDVYNQNQLTKIEAVEADMREQETDEISHVDGAIMAVQIGDIEQISKEVKEVSNEIQGLIEQVGAEGSGLQENGLGQLSFLADENEKNAATLEKQAKTTERSDKVNALWKKAMELKSQSAELKAQVLRIKAQRN